MDQREPVTAVGALLYANKLMTDWALLQDPPSPPSPPSPPDISRRGILVAALSAPLFKVAAAATPPGTSPVPPPPPLDHAPSALPSPGVSDTEAAGFSELRSNGDNVGLERTIRLGLILGEGGTGVVHEGLLYPPRVAAPVDTSDRSKCSGGGGDGEGGQPAAIKVALLDKAGAADRLAVEFKAYHRLDRGGPQVAGGRGGDLQGSIVPR